MANHTLVQVCYAHALLFRIGVNVTASNICVLLLSIPRHLFFLPTPFPSLLHCSSPLSLPLSSTSQLPRAMPVRKNGIPLCTNQEGSGRWYQ